MTDEPLAKLEADHRREKAELRETTGLSWEEKVRRI